MLFRGIVLRTVKYRDAELIVDFFTLSHGRLSFVTHVSHSSRKSSQGASFWRPLNLLEFEAELPVPTARRLPRPKDVRVYENYADIPYHPVKSTLALFLSEFLSNVLRDTQSDATLYNYIEYSLRWLDAASHHLANFHLVFMIQLTRFVGIYPNLADCAPLRFFDLVQGTYCDGQPPHSSFLSPEEAQFLPMLSRMNYANMHLFRFSRQQRWRCLEVINNYYSVHFPQFPQLRSLSVLREVFD